MRFSFSRSLCESRMGRAMLAGLLAIVVWRMAFAVPQPHIDQAQLAQLKARKAATQVAE